MGGIIDVILQNIESTYQLKPTNDKLQKEIKEKNSEIVYLTYRIMELGDIIEDLISKLARCNDANEYLKLNLGDLKTEIANCHANIQQLIDSDQEPEPEKSKKKKEIIYKEESPTSNDGEISLHAFLEYVKKRKEIENKINK